MIRRRCHPDGIYSNRIMFVKSLEIIYSKKDLHVRYVHKNIIIIWRFAFLYFLTAFCKFVNLTWLSMYVFLPSLNELVKSVSNCRLLFLLNSRSYSFEFVPLYKFS